MDNQFLLSNIFPIQLTVSNPLMMVIIVQLAVSNFYPWVVHLGLDKWWLVSKTKRKGCQVFLEQNSSILFENFSFLFGHLPWITLGNKRYSLLFRSTKKVSFHVCGILKMKLILFSTLDLKLARCVQPSSTFSHLVHHYVR